MSVSSGEVDLRRRAKQEASLSPGTAIRRKPSRRRWPFFDFKPRGARKLRVLAVTLIPHLLATEPPEFGLED
jgi:hypothetical protein